ncbi:MAG TPA: biopolymer transporter ExbD [Porphyromonadaceae bacterium]|nr:biopolymer transporter ExbD [Porphyromonadaceae bacterium]
MPRRKRKIPEINSSSSADIAFLLLIFFLITTSMNTDRGLARRLPPPIPKEQEQKDMEIKQRNILLILVNSNNQLMVAGELMNVSNLKEKVKEFISNPYDLPHLPEKTEKEVPFLGKVKCCDKGVISLQNDRFTEYQAYIEVQNELVSAYNELRDEYAKREWGKTYAELPKAKQDAIKKVYPQNISEAEPKNYGGKR